MQYIQGEHREQTILFPQTLDQIISADNEVRIIDLFAESIDLADFKFEIKNATGGRHAYHPKDLLKLFVYGYLNCIRSSRTLEKECHRNIELMWLMKKLPPDHNTIANFRKDNDKAIRQVFRYTVTMAAQFNLIGRKLIAGDSTKPRAQNSKKNNFNEDKIDQHLAYIENKLNEYNSALEAADNNDPQDAANKDVIEAEIKKQQDRKEFYNDLSNQLQQSGDTQISTTDPNSRQLITRNNITEVAYNVQTLVDAKHNLPIDYKVTNENDSKAMGSMLRRAKTILQTNEFTAFFDKGYHVGSEIKKAVEMGINVVVSYGIIKRQWGFYFISTKKSLKHASADVGLMFVAYNLRRLMNIIDKNVFKKFLQELVSLFFRKTGLTNAIRCFFSLRNFQNQFLKINFPPGYNSLKVNYI